MKRNLRESQTGPTLTDSQIEKYKEKMVSKGLPVRFLHNGQALDIVSGELASKGSNVMYHPVYWNFTKETAKEIAKDLGVRAVFGDEEDDIVRESETFRNYTKQKTNFEVGDRVILRPDVLKRHSQSVPAHAGYTREQFSWRKTLGRLQGMVGTIERIFPNSKHVNVEFEDGTLIGLDSTELEKANDVMQEGKMPKGGWDKKYRVGQGEGNKTTQFIATKEFRKPKKGEWYLSGAIPEAYQAKADMQTEYYILRPVGKEKADKKLEEQIRNTVREVIASLISETFYVSNRGELSFGEEKDDEYGFKGKKGKIVGYVGWWIGENLITEVPMYDGERVGDTRERARSHVDDNIRFGISSDYPSSALDHATPKFYPLGVGKKVAGIHESKLEEGDTKILLQDDDDADIEAEKTQKYTNEEGVKFWAKYNPKVKAWVCFQQVEGYPETEAWDDWFGNKEDAEDVCKKLADGTL